MAELSRAQIAVYGAIAVAVLLIGVRAIGGGSRETAAFGSSGAGGGSPSSFGLSAEGGRDVVVDVAGAVRDPGVYRLPAGARVVDAVDRAGGRDGGAELEAINLAARLADGQQIVVPQRSPTTAGGAGVGAATATDGPISLGTATVEQLDTIEGIGPVTAEDIVQYRDEHGGLSSIEQLDEISGIGPATMEALRDRLQP
jgi:competence protein ComEA